MASGGSRSSTSPPSTTRGTPVIPRNPVCRSVPVAVSENNQEGLGVSDRHIRRTLAELEAKGLVESTTPSKRRQTYAVTEDGHETLAGMRASLNRALGVIDS
ncbi:hypothetical protein GOC83_19400 [Haloarcula rubripromontorii]|uniref:Transcriptional regulator n=1 Tax=Haloarcula rubripromontorii TaxID=1705562 RepID=A0A847U6Q2_9EURY|nr:winged helix DNA-binding protein [Haloarcula rubripromontorii]NLV08286.1 hypothetical protein [Haloarcula rubripromontorii]